MSGIVAAGYTHYTASSGPWVFVIVGLLMLLTGAIVSFNFSGVRDRWLNYSSKGESPNEDRGAEIGNLAISVVGYAFLAFGAIFTISGLVNAI